MWMLSEVRWPKAEQLDYLNLFSIPHWEEIAPQVISGP